MDHDLYLHVAYAEFCEVTLCFEYYMYCNNPNTGNCQTNFSCMCVCVCVCTERNFTPVHITKLCSYCYDYTSQMSIIKRMVYYLYVNPLPILLRS